MKVELKNVKINKEMSDETESFSATIYIDGKKAAFVHNHGMGGPHEYNFADNKVYKNFCEFCNEQPHEFELDVEDQFINDLLEKWETNQKLKKWCNKNIVVKLTDMKEDDWILIRAPGIRNHYGNFQRIRAACEEEYGDELIEIVNERFIKG